MTFTKWRTKSCSFKAYAEKILPPQAPTKRHSQALQFLHFLSRPRETSLGQLGSELDSSGVCDSRSRWVRRWSEGKDAALVMMAMMRRQGDAQCQGTSFRATSIFGNLVRSIWDLSLLCVWILQMKSLVFLFAISVTSYKSGPHAGMLLSECIILYPSS